MLCKLSLHDIHTWHMADSETETQRRRKRAKFIYLKFICVTRFCLFWPNKNIDDYLMLCVPCFANLYLQNCLCWKAWTLCRVSFILGLCVVSLKMCIIERTFNIVSRVIINGEKVDKGLLLIALNIQQLQKHKGLENASHLAWWNASKRDKDTF